MFIELIVAFISTLAFAVVFNVPVRYLLLAIVPLRLVRKGGERHIRKSAYTRITSIDSPKR